MDSETRDLLRKRVSRPDYYRNCRRARDVTKAFCCPNAPIGAENFCIASALVYAFESRIDNRIESRPRFEDEPRALSLSWTSLIPKLAPEGLGALWRNARLRVRTWRRPTRCLSLSRLRVRQILGLGRTEPVPPTPGRAEAPQAARAAAGQPESQA